MKQESEKNIIEEREKIIENEFTESSLEKEILELEERLAEKKREKERRQERKEIFTKKKKIPVKKEIEMKEKIEEKSAYPKTSVTTDDDQDQQAILADNRIVEDLIETAFNEGITKTIIKKVKHLKNPYILDEFHYRLMKRLKALEKKILKR